MQLSVFIFIPYKGLSESSRTLINPCKSLQNLVHRYFTDLHKLFQMRTTPQNYSQIVEIPYRDLYTPFCRSSLLIRITCKTLGFRSMACNLIHILANLCKRLKTMFLNGNCAVLCKPYQMRTNPQKCLQILAHPCKSVHILANPYTS